jgi:hypothetical protein
MNIPPPSAKPLLPPPRAAGATPLPVSTSVSTPAFDAFGLLAAPAAAPSAFSGATFAVAPPPPPPRPLPPQPAVAASTDLLNLLDSPPAASRPYQPALDMASFAAFPAPTAAPQGAAPLDLFSLAPPPNAFGMAAPLPPPTQPLAAAVDPFAFAGVTPLFGLSAPSPAQPAAGGMRPPVAALGGGPALGGAMAGAMGTTARKPATLDETLNASLANLGLGQPFARP